MSKIPAHAAVDEAVNLAKRYSYPGMVKFINALLREVTYRRGEIMPPDREKDPALFLAVVNSHPLWLVKKWIEEIGLEETEELTAANNLCPK